MWWRNFPQPVYIQETLKAVKLVFHSFSLFFHLGKSRVRPWMVRGLSMWYLSSSSENCTSSVEREGREDNLLIPWAMELKLILLRVLGLTGWPPKAFSSLWLYDCRNKLCNLSKVSIQKIFYPVNLIWSITVFWKSEQLPTLLWHILGLKMKTNERSHSP